VSAPADLALVRRLLEETGVEQRHPPPGWSGYFEALADAFTEWLRDRLPNLQGLSALPAQLGLLAALVGAVLVASILYSVGRAVLRRRRDPRATTPPAPSPSTASRGVEHDRQGWRQEIDRRLEAGDVESSLEALWWWFARSVSADRVDASWTSHELLARCARADLAPLARALDRLLYGSQRPRADDLRRFLGRLEAALP
jgi:hypothetical protein